jgi:hypothetical protein
MSAQCWRSNEVAGLRKAQLSLLKGRESPWGNQLGSHSGNTKTNTGAGKSMVLFSTLIVVCFDLSQVQGPWSRSGSS